MQNISGNEIQKQTKKCNRCKTDLPYNEFGHDSGGKKLRSWCKPCDKEVNRDRRRLRKLIALPDKDYCCPLCGKNEEELNETIQFTTKKVSPWVCDHDHKQVKVRGWLCRKCNLALGNFNDDINILKNAIEWLQKHG
jgi:hypothetical protein